MRTLDNIPTTKIERAGKLMSTGVRVGGNYVKYYGKKLVNPSLSREELDQDNADDIYNGLKQLKGSALKVAQMLSMDKNMLPGAYVEKFSLAQFSVPPLSAPLVRRTFKKYTGNYPEDIFDTFDNNSINAASIGQVHRATLNGKQLAVKIQYPGVSESISTDLALVKPIAIRMFNLKSSDTDKYFEEVENKLVEETNYLLEIAQSCEITDACKSIPNLIFPKYYPELSGERMIAMDWMTGKHLSEFTQGQFSRSAGNKLGQTLWDFYMFQIHRLRKVHADPHPGNFLVSEHQELIAIDFGCIKEIPDEFYLPYFELAQKENITNEKVFLSKLYQLEILKSSDTEEELKFFSAIFREMLMLFTTPFHEDKFDFGNPDFWNKIAALSERFSKDENLRKMNGSRGSKHFLYMNRTFFGLYNLLHDLRAEVSINNFREY